MATVGFANSNSGPKAASIGWFDFTGVTLAPNTSLSMANSLPNGGNIAFTIRNIMISGNVSFSGHVAPQRAGIPFGNTNYTGIPGQPLLNATAVLNGSADLIISNITITNAQGVTIPFGLVVAEAEGSVQNELITCTTNGSPWDLIANIYGSVANISGINTTIVSWGGANPWPSPVVSTNNPSTILVNDFENSNSAIALGLILTPITIKKYVVNRLDVSDQFQLDITGPLPSTTITTGIVTGTQPNYAFTYGDDGQSYILNELMAPGSLNTLSQYATTISIVNTSQGGTTIPSNWTLGQPLTVQMGDNINLVITNTPIIPKLTAVKNTNEIYGAAGDIITYNVILTNTYPNMAINTVALDTVPNGVTLVPGSVTVNGVAVSGGLTPIYLGTIPANSVTTIAYQVVVNTIPPIISPIKNSSTQTHSYTVVTNTLPIFGVLSNVVTTTISSPIINSQKIVNKSTANIGDILIYTIPISNTGNVDAFNVSFIDTIPTGTMLITNSLKQDGIVVAGSPGSPGVILPNSIGTGKTSTITFQVLVTTTPGVSQVSNSAMFAYNYAVTSTITNFRVNDTNTVVTNINGMVSMNFNKYVDKVYSTCGDTITYIIVATNNGNTSADDVTFIDTIPKGTVFISDTFTQNGSVIIGANPQNGVALPNINSGETITLGFQVKITCS
ncbi:MAG: hypothetical protein ACRC7N_22075 [Clostridium sp.]